MSTKPDSSQIKYDTGTVKDILDGVKSSAGASLVGYDGGTVQDVLDSAKPMANYTALRAYTGRATSVRITTPGIAGIFSRDSDVVTADNGGTVIVDASGRRWKRVFDGSVTILWFGAKPTSLVPGFDSTSAIQAAAVAAGTYGSLLFPVGEYLAYGQLQQLDGQKWYSEGGQRSVSIRKMFNGDLFIPGSLGTTESINFNASGNTFSGRGIYVNSGFSLRLERVRVSESAGPALEFADGAGAGSHICNFEGDTTNPTVVPAIKIQDTTGASPKFFDGVWLPGGLFDFSGGGNGSSLTNFYIRNFVTTAPNYPSFAAASGLFHVSNGRVASINDTTTLSGFDYELTNVAFSGPVILDKAQGLKLAGCSYGAGVTETADCRYNSIEDQLKVFTPSWTQDSGTQPSVGDGSLTGHYIRQGYACSVNIYLIAGSTTTFGNNSTGYRFSLPFPGHESVTQRGLPVTVRIGTTSYACSAAVVAGESAFSISFGSQEARSDFPAVWVAGSVMEVSFAYATK